MRLTIGMKSSITSKSATIIVPTIPDDLMPEILSKLPAKCLVQLRCVSKSWRELIDSPAFIDMHLHQSIITRPDSGSDSDILMVQGLKAWTLNFYGDDLRLAKAKHTFTCSLKNRYNMLEFVGACNGILCLLNNPIKVEHYILWNPCTGKYRIIANPKFPNSYSYRYYYFGYDRISDDYKIVSMARSILNGYELEIYSLKGNSLRIIDEQFPRGARCSLETGTSTVIGGAIHWLVTDEVSNVADSIVAFDLATEKYSELPLPANCSYFDALGDLGGCLCAFGYCANGFPRNLWVMREYGCWTKLFQIESDYPYWKYLFKGIAYSESHSQVLLQTMAIDRRLMCYDHGEKSLTQVNICPSITEATACVWTGSLVQL